MENLEQQLRDYIARNFLFRDDFAFSNDDSFLDSGIIDSTGVLELISMLEESYAIKVNDTELVPENLDSIAGLARYIRAKTSAVLEGAQRR